MQKLKENVPTQNYELLSHFRLQSLLIALSLFSLSLPSLSSLSLLKISNLNIFIGEGGVCKIQFVWFHNSYNELERIVTLKHEKGLLCILNRANCSDRRHSCFKKKTQFYLMNQYGTDVNFCLPIPCFVEVSSVNIPLFFPLLPTF